MPKPRPETVIATYRVKKGRERAFHVLLKGHWPTLRREGLVTPTKSVIYRGKDDSGAYVYYEIFSWVSAKAVRDAHTNPAIHALWGRFADFVEDRGGRPKWEFPHVDEVWL